ATIIDQQSLAGGPPSPSRRSGQRPHTFIVKGHLRAFPRSSGTSGLSTSTTGSSCSSLQPSKRGTVSEKIGLLNSRVTLALRNQPVQTTASHSYEVETS